MLFVARTGAFVSCTYPKCGPRVVARLSMMPWGTSLSAFRNVSGTMISRMIPVRRAPSGNFSVRAFASIPWPLLLCEFPAFTPIGIIIGLFRRC